jgi:hypothetical protein
MTSEGGPTPEELEADQARREREERDQAADAATEEEVRVHERRAEKAGYLRRKLAEREESERR